MVRFSKHNTLQVSTKEIASQVEQDSFGIDTIQLQFAALFDDCVRRANRAADVSVVEHVVPELLEPTANNRILSKILASTPEGENRANIITVTPLGGGGTTSHIFHLRKVEDERSIETYFRVVHDTDDVRDIKGAKLHQVFGEGDSKREKIIEVDAAGHFQDRHIGGGNDTALISDPNVCQPDLEVVATAISEPLGDALKHTTAEFDKVVRIDRATSLVSRLGGAAAGFRSPDRIVA